MNEDRINSLFEERSVLTVRGREISNRENFSAEDNTELEAVNTELESLDGKIDVLEEQETAARANAERFNTREGREPAIRSWPGGAAVAQTRAPNDEVETLSWLDSCRCLR